jgi:hypothetical protein
MMSMHVEERKLLISNEDCDLSLDGYDSYQSPPLYHSDDTVKDDDLLEGMF